MNLILEGLKALCLPPTIQGNAYYLKTQGKFIRQNHIASLLQSHRTMSEDKYIQFTFVKRKDILVSQ